MAYKPEEKKRILNSYAKQVEAGVTVLEAAKACGVPYFTISRWLKAAGKTVKPNAEAAAPGTRKKIHYSKERQAEILEQYDELVAQGARVLDAAEKLGVAYLTIRRWQDAHGHKPSSQAKRSAGPKRKAKKATRAIQPSEDQATTSKYTLITPEGFRVEAQSAKDMAKVLNELR